MPIILWQFYRKKGEDGVYLSNWNITELKEIVSEFTSIYKPNEDENNAII